MKNFFSLLILLLPVMGIAQTSPSTPAKQTRLENMLGKSGYEFSKAADNVFVCTQEGKNMKELVIIATEADDITVLFCVIKEKSSEGMTVSQYKQLLKLALEYDKVKIGLDDEDSLMIRVDYSTRLVDLDDLILGLNNLSAASDEAYAIVVKK
ncbi:MAG TPA: hypothetical protein VLC98_16910 [Phnomibacter sp.]|nr:hypothetical protein [Phnomibacter sp.]